MERLSFIYVGGLPGGKLYSRRIFAGCILSFSKDCCVSGFYYWQLRILDRVGAGQSLMFSFDFIFMPCVRRAVGWLMSL